MAKIRTDFKKILTSVRIYFIFYLPKLFGGNKMAIKKTVEERVAVIDAKIAKKQDEISAL